eukprot:1302572-Pleurochrysis_carterae.AAC.2
MLAGISEASLVAPILTNSGVISVRKSARRIHLSATPRPRPPSASTYTRRARVRSGSICSRRMRIHPGGPDNAPVHEKLKSALVVIRQQLTACG